MMALKPELDLQISVESDDWPEETKLERMAGRVLSHTAEFISIHEGQPFGASPLEVSLVFTDDAAIRIINAKWRRQDKPTNVLSFPAYPIQPGDEPGPMLGDIIVARETLEREAADLAKPFDEHLIHLLVHGFLHLFGYDHVNEEEADQMEALETRILAGLGLSDPYGQDDPI